MLAIDVKKHAKVDIKIFLCCLILPAFSILLQIFCLGLQLLVVFKFYVFRRQAKFEYISAFSNQRNNSEKGTSFNDQRKL